MMDSVEYILKLQKEAGEDFWLASLTAEGSKWENWKRASETTIREKEQATDRSILSYELIADIETKESKIINAIDDELRTAELFFEKWDTGGRGFHYKLIYPELKELPDETRPKVKQFILSRYFGENADLQKTGNKCMISLEWSKHRKTGKQKKLIMEKHGENKFDKTIKKHIKCLEKKQKKESKENRIETSLYITDDIIAEQVCEDGISSFCVFDVKTEKISYVSEIRVFDVVYVPIVAEEVTKGAILLPSKAEEYGTDEELDNEIKSHINKWLDVPEDILQFGNWNVKRSWVFERFHTLNYLRALGDTGQGKTRFLDTLGYIHYKPIATSGATTSAPVFRIIDKWRGTLIMDEADFQKSDESQDIIKIINMGYEKGKYVMRCDQNDAKKIDFFDPYCPKILATRKTFTDKATESRCITYVMQGTDRQDIPLNLNKSFWDAALRLRNKLLMWRFRNYNKINPDKEATFDLGYLEPRVKQIVSSFISLFSNDTEQLKLFKKFIRKHQEELIDERKNSFDGVIVGAIYELVVERKVSNISTQDIIETGNITDKKGNLLKARALTSSLKSLGFKKSKQKKVDGENKRCLPLEKNHLISLFRRYGFEVTEVTVVTIDAVSGDNEKEAQIELFPSENKVIEKNKEATDTIVTSVTTDTIVTPLKWDDKCIVWQKCQIESCTETECNLDSDNVPYCKKHWPDMAN